jgi:hypothetical protein
VVSEQQHREEHQADDDDGDVLKELLEREDFTQ